MKKSKLESKTSKYIIAILCVEIILCLTASIYSACWDVLYAADTNSYMYWNFSNSLATSSFWFKLLFSIGNWLLILTDFVPISLLVTSEVVKFWQAFFISSDILMYDDNLGQPAKVQASNLNEELGQVEYIFSDKTGTLTCNIMEFKCMSIGDISYGQREDGQSLNKNINNPQITNVGFQDNLIYSNMYDEKHPNYDII